MKIDEIIEEREKFIRNVIPLQPSENYICKKARDALSSDFQTRYSLKLDQFRGMKIDNAYAGASISETLMEEVTRSAISYFRAEFADIRPISGHLAAMQVLGNILKRGDKFLYVGLENGGYDGYQEQYLQQLLGIRGTKFPFKGWNIDYEKLEKYDKDFKALVLGASVIFEPYDLSRLKEIFPDAMILYDASHLLSLFSTDKFQPRSDLIDVIYGSTHKNFPGPQGGIIFGKSEYGEIVMRDVIWKYYDNFHIGRIASLGVSIEFAARTNYAERCLSNTQEFIKNGISAGLRIVNPPIYTKTCMLQFDYPDNVQISKKLEANRILIDRIGRVGLNEVTSLGLNIKQVSEIPYIIQEILNGDSPSNRIDEIINQFVRS